MSNTLYTDVEIDSIYTLDRCVISPIHNNDVKEIVLQINKEHLGKFELTFYSKEQFPNSPTATGVMPSVGRTVAVDPSVIPYGTVIEIDGFGIRCAEDTGGAIKGNKIDVFVETTAEAYQFGRQKDVDVWVVK